MHIYIDADTYLGNSSEYMEVHVYHPYIAMVLDLYMSLTELHLNSVHTKL